MTAAAEVSCSHQVRETGATEQENWHVETNHQDLKRVISKLQITMMVVVSYLIEYV